MLRRVHNGTPDFSDSSLCTGCRYGAQVRGTQYRNEFTWCAYYEREMHFLVKECTKFDDASTPSIHEMRLIAWRLASDKKGHTIGFKNPQQFNELREEKKVQLTEEDENF